MTLYQAALDAICSSLDTKTIVFCTRDPGVMPSVQAEQAGRSAVGGWLTSAMRQPSRHLAVLLSASSSRADSSGGLLASCISSEIKLHMQEYSSHAYTWSTCKLSVTSPVSAPLRATV